MQDVKHPTKVTVLGVAIEIGVRASPALISKCGAEIGRSPAFDFYITGKLTKIFSALRAHPAVPVRPYRGVPLTLFSNAQDGWC